MTQSNTLLLGCKNTTIPNSVTSIGDEAFRNCSGLTSVTIPESVTNIGIYAFKGCNNLTSITNHSSVAKIPTDAFTETAWYRNQPDGVIYLGKILYGYKGTMPENTSITIRNGVTTINDKAFYNILESYSGLTSVTIPNSVTSIGEYAFYSCRGLTSVTIPNSVTSIGASAFNGCSSLTSVTIPESVTSIGSYAFRNCSGLTSITNYSSVAKIPTDAFTETALYRNQPDGVIYLGERLYTYKGTMPKNTSITIRNGVTSIGDYAFEGCSNLTSITIPNSVTSIGDYAFRFTGLTSVTIPESVTSIGRAAFNFCGAQTSVTIPNSVTSIEAGTFTHCHDLISITIPNSVTSIGDRAFWNCSGLTSITIPNSVTSIGEEAFECSGLTSVTIPSSVTSIGDKVFSDCDDLISIVVSGNNPKYNSQENCNAIIETESNILLQGCKNTIIPNSVTSIGDYAFYWCSGLTSITIPNSVTSIGDYAFYCSGLTSVTIPESVTSIGAAAFYRCSGLTSVTIPNSVTSIDDGAFQYCSGLTSVTIPESVTSIGNYAFASCSGLTSVTIPESVTTIGDRAFAYCSGLTSITCLATTPPGCPDNNFNEVNKGDCLLYVPSKSVTAYTNADVWKEFNIVGIKPIYNKGDANGDSQIDVADFTAIANFILGSIPENFEEDAADVNKDEIVNVADITGVANIILYGSLNSSAAAKGIGGMEYRIPVTQAKDFAISAGGEYVMDIDIDNPDMQFSACQFDVHLPKGISIKSVTLGKDRTTSKKTNYLDFATLADGTTRVICASTKDVAFAGTEGTVARLTVVAEDNVEAGSYDVTIDNIVLSKAGDMAKPESVTINADIISATGISEIKTTEPNSADGMYDILGRRISNSEKLRDGIYIIRGKKVIK